MASRPELLAALRRYWGYDSFRPLQERIVSSLLAGRDTCVVMPTGGGKSLCYQLPAAMSAGKTVIVISPLIALMQDQIAQLGQMGISAGMLNSSLPEQEQSLIVSNAAECRYRLLYLSPERLTRADTIGWLARVPISFFAIDEAHCISEWGHEFRPEYRQLSSLRAQFPDRHIAAFTASATRQVRHDIIEQLRLRDPDKYIASFRRSNLHYLIKECDSASQSAALLAALAKYAGSNIIVYAPTIKGVEETVAFLEARGIPAIAYHGKMDADARRYNQERWTSDEVRVLVGTIAFGLGINKAAVRAVIHLSLPKSIEQYYQEAGRAGRDGLPADCIMLWQKRDVGLLTYFVQQISDPEERDRAWTRYSQVRRFVESRACRHRQICSHFGEIPKWESCHSCDVCTGEPAWLASITIDKRPKKKRRRVSSVDSPSTPLQPSSSTTAARLPVRQTSTTSALASVRDVPDSSFPLREYLREWRRNVAKQQGIAAFIVMHDTTLDDLCRKKPRSLDALRAVSGFGERKTALYGEQILDTLREFDRGARATPIPEKKLTPADETIQLLREGRAFEEIAKIRGRQLVTVIGTVADLIEMGDLDFQPHWVDAAKQLQIEAVGATIGLDRLKPLKDALPPEISYDELKLVVAKLRRQRSQG